MPSFRRSCPSPRSPPPSPSIPPAPYPSHHPDSFYTSLLHLSTLMHQSNHGVLNIQRIKDVIGGRYVRFAGNSQQDAHEFLSECLNCLHDDLVSCLRSAAGAGAGARGAWGGGEGGAVGMVREVSGDSASDESTGGLSRSPSPMPLPLQTGLSAQAPPSASTPLPRPSSSSPSGCPPCTAPSSSPSSTPCSAPTPPAPTRALTTSRSMTSPSTFRPRAPRPRLLLPRPVPHQVALTRSLTDVVAGGVATAPLLPHSTPSDPLPFHPSHLPLSCHPPTLRLPSIIEPSTPTPTPSQPLAGATNPPHPPLPPSPPSLHLLLPRTLSCKCSHCDSTEVRVSSTVSRLPRVLILHLKRFLPTWSRGAYEKRSDRVKVEREVDLTFACTQRTKRPGEGEEGGAGGEGGGGGAKGADVGQGVDEAKAGSAMEEDLMEVKEGNGVPPRLPSAHRKRLSEEIDFTDAFSDDSEPSPTSSSDSSSKRRKGEGSPAPALVSRPSRRRPSPDAEIRVTRAMHRKQHQHLPNHASPSPPPAPSTPNTSTSSTTSPLYVPPLPAVVHRAAQRRCSVRQGTTWRTW